MLRPAAAGLCMTRGGWNDESVGYGTLRVSGGFGRPPGPKKGISAHDPPVPPPFLFRHPSTMEPITENRRARHDYDIREIFEAGIELLGGEVKSAREGKFQIVGAQALVRGGEVWLVNSHIPPYQPKNTAADYAEDRPRKLLLTAQEIKRITGLLHDKSERLIPLRAYPKKRLIKLEIGIGRARKRSDQREVLKKRAHLREMREV